ncbi:sulfite oxidase heme-binding subunit YedZ [Pseudomonadota bacterium]
MTKTFMSYRATWWLAFMAMAAPLLALVGFAFTGGLGANPIEFINRYLGDWALRALLVALAATPLKILFGWTWALRMRRMLGLWAFAYVTLHITNYVAIDQFFDWQAIGKDIIKRTYMTLGMTAFTILTVLAITSPKRMVKKLGAQTWQRLHRLVYAAGILGCVHYYMMVKADTVPPLLHAGVLAVLLFIRLYHRVRG